MLKDKPGGIVYYNVIEAREALLDELLVPMRAACPNRSLYHYIMIPRIVSRANRAGKGVLFPFRVTLFLSFGVGVLPMSGSLPVLGRFLC